MSCEAHPVSWPLLSYKQALCAKCMGTLQDNHKIMRAEWTNELAGVHLSLDIAIDIDIYIYGVKTRCGEREVRHECLEVIASCCIAELTSSRSNTTSDQAEVLDVHDPERGEKIPREKRAGEDRDRRVNIIKSRKEKDLEGDGGTVRGETKTKAADAEHEIHKQREMVWGAKNDAPLLPALRIPPMHARSLQLHVEIADYRDDPSGHNLPQWIAQSARAFPVLDPQVSKPLQLCRSFFQNLPLARFQEIHLLKRICVLHPLIFESTQPWMAHTCIHAQVGEPRQPSRLASVRLHQSFPGRRLGPSIFPSTSILLVLSHSSAFTAKSTCSPNCKYSSTIPIVLSAI
ncbi:hypothetical protein B0H14DRAFT_2640445 [Mycena olivaceomarginata]|nr:hypothetical protein B0H14DRAFT_2640445 [Mycena olivaceomarginata]